MLMHLLTTPDCVMHGYRPIFRFYVHVVISVNLLWILGSLPFSPFLLNFQIGCLCGKMVLLDLFSPRYITSLLENVFQKIFNRKSKFFSKSFFKFWFTFIFIYLINLFFLFIYLSPSGAFIGYHMDALCFIIYAFSLWVFLVYNS